MTDNKIREIRVIRENPRFRHYPEYKDSGVEWIGEIPGYWNLVMLKYKARLVYGDTLISENRENGVVPVYGSNGIIDTHSSANTLSPAIIIGRKGSLGKIQYSDVPCFVIDTAYFIDRRTSHVNLRWLHYVLQALKLERFRNSVLPGLNRDSAESQYIPLIRKEDQTQIANFLDRKTKQIDEIIRIKEQQIELLHEQRTALINQAVTKGLDPNVEMKPSGVEWIGAIPAHWIISKVKYEFESLDNLRIPLNAETRGSMKSKIYDYYGASGVIDKVEDYIFNEPLILIGEDGANLYLRSTPLAFKATGKYWVNNHAHVLKPKQGNIDYLTNILESLDYTHYITGAAQPKLTSERLMNITVTIPPPFEQAQIADFLNSKTQQIDELITTEQRKIELLKEYRQSLISEAVTGKIDVRNEV